MRNKNTFVNLKKRKRLLCFLKVVIIIMFIVSNVIFWRLYNNAVVIPALEIIKKTNIWEFSVVTVFEIIAIALLYIVYGAACANIYRSIWAKIKTSTLGLVSFDEFHKIVVQENISVALVEKFKCRRGKPNNFIKIEDADMDYKEYSKSVLDYSNKQSIKGYDLKDIIDLIKLDKKVKNIEALINQNSK